MVKYNVCFLNRFIPRTQIEPIKRAKGEIETRGYKWVIDGSEDITLFQGRLLQHQPFEEWLKQIKTPIIILDSSDGVAFRYADLFKHKRVIGYIKKQLLWDRELYKYDYVEDRYHFWLYAATQRNKEAYQPKISNTQIDWDKVQLGWNLGVSNTVYDLLQKEIPQKDIDIHCSLRTGNNGSIIYEAHRKKCIRETFFNAQRYNLKVSEKAWFSQYYNQMARSHIVMNAWGLGEVCLRHFEAAVLKCISISPPMGHIETWPDIFVDNETYIPCDINFQNLKYAYRTVFTNLKRFEGMTDKAYDIVKEANDNEAFADRFAGIMQRILK
jgi:hypothetical protein